MTKNVYKVDLSSTDKEGGFSCPSCGIKIDPKDENKEIYEVVEVKMRGDVEHSAIIDCRKCGSEIELEFS